MPVRVLCFLKFFLVVSPPCLVRTKLVDEGGQKRQDQETRVARQAYGMVVRIHGSALNHPLLVPSGYPFPCCRLFPLFFSVCLPVPSNSPDAAAGGAERLGCVCRCCCSARETPARGPLWTPVPSAHADQKKHVLLGFRAVRQCQQHGGPACARSFRMCLVVSSPKRPRRPVCRGLACSSLASPRVEPWWPGGVTNRPGSATCCYVCPPTHMK